MSRYPLSWVLTTVKVVSSRRGSSVSRTNGIHRRALRPSRALRAATSGKHANPAILRCRSRADHHPAASRSRDEDKPLGLVTARVLRLVRSNPHEGLLKEHKIGRREMRPVENDFFGAGRGVHYLISRANAAT